VEEQTVEDVRNVEDGPKAGSGNPVERGLRTLISRRGKRPQGRRSTWRHGGQVTIESSLKEKQAHERMLPHS
jgi:hypothetical protein